MLYLKGTDMICMHANDIGECNVGMGVCEVMYVCVREILCV